MTNPIVGCPHCGHEMIKFVSAQSSGDDVPYWIVACQGCDVASPKRPHSYSEDKAIELASRYVRRVLADRLHNLLTVRVEKTAAGYLTRDDIKAIVFGSYMWLCANPLKLPGEES